MLCSITKFDIKNYFQSIYNINVALVNTRIQQGVVVVVVIIVVFIVAHLSLMHVGLLYMTN